MNLGKLKTSHLVEGGLWLAFCLFLWVYSYEFDRDIEIYKFGASSWPRAIIILMALAAIGQLVHHYFRGDEASSEMISKAVDDGSHEAAEEAHHSSVSWYLSTFALLVIPFAYLLLPNWIIAAMAAEGMTVHVIRVVIALILVTIFASFMNRNHVGGILTLPLLFAVLLEDLGFYSLAPFFVVGVMFLFGERRIKWMVPVMVLILGLLLALFVSILYVGLPTGNIHPFYDIGTWVVTVLQ